MIAVRLLGRSSIHQTPLNQTPLNQTMCGKPCAANHVQAIGERDAFGTGSAGGQRSALLSPTKRNWRSSSGEDSPGKVSKGGTRKAPS